MSNIRFIIQGSQAGDIALELKHYLESEWNAEVKSKVADSPVVPVTGAYAKSFDPEAMQILLQVYGAYKFFKDDVLDLPETKRKLENLVQWLDEKFTEYYYENIWLEVNGIPYPVKIEDLDTIIKALEKQE